MIEFPVWAIVVLSVLAAPTVTLALLISIDLLVDLFERN